MSHICQIRDNSPTQCLVFQISKSPYYSSRVVNEKSKTNGFSLSFDVGESNVAFLKYGLLAKIRQSSHLSKPGKISDTTTWATNNKMAISWLLGHKCKK